MPGQIAQTMPLRQLCLIKDVPRNLSLKFGQGQLSNNWDSMADLEFVSDPTYVSLG